MSGTSKETVRGVRWRIASRSRRGTCWRTARRRTGCKTNQLRLYFASFAYGMMDGFRRPGLGGTKRARAQCGTTREKVLKVGAEIRVSVRKVWLSMSGRDPRAEWLRRILARLQAVPLRCSVIGVVV